MRDASILVIASLPPVAMTIGIVRPQLVPVVDLLNATAVFALLSVVLVAVDLAVVALLDRVLRDALEQRQVVILVLLLTVLLYGPLRQRLSSVVRRLVLGDRTSPYDVVAGLASTLEQADEGSEQLAAVADAVASAFGVGYVRVEVDRAERRAARGHARDCARRDADAADHLPRPGGRAGACCRPADYAAASPAATSSCSATWSGRRPPQRGPASSPTSSRTAGSGWSSRARRSAAGSAATCTTGSARP